MKRFKKLTVAWTQKPEQVYLWIAIVAVFAFALITPPFQGPDEQAHFIRAQYIANGFLMPSAEAKLPKSIATVTKITFYTDDIRGRTSDKYEPGRTVEALKVPLNRGDTYRPPMIMYSPILYLPAVPGIVLSNALNFSPLVAMYSARLSLGLVSIILFFFATKLIPHKKYLLAAVGLIPMMLFQEAMITADSISYALLALFIAYTLYLREKEVIGRRGWIMLGLVCVGVTLAKPLTFLFLPLVLVLIKKKNAIKWLASIAVICALLLVGWMAVSSTKSEAVPTWGMPSNVDSTKQTQLIVHNPKRGLRVMWNTYMTQYGDDEVRGVLGVFGAADVLYPLWMVIGYAGVLGIAAIISYDQRANKKPLHRGWKLFAFALCAVYFVLVNFALYTGYTPVNFDIVYGVQGRYFLPILIIAATTIFTGGLIIKKTDTEKTQRQLVVAIAVLVFLALFVTFQRYYLYTP